MIKRPCGKSINRISTIAKRPAVTAPSACSDLKCLCRPRFFAGQLLTEKDLNLLDCYITEKNKLHNRYLHGWGVVCGLEVRCHECDDQVVTVSPGYALSPCGEDIVVCHEDTVPVCDLINECRERERSKEPCRPYGHSPDCPEQDENWVLAIRYEERPERAIAALRQATGCNTSANEKLKPREAPVQCEPTVVCESYRYEVFRAPPPKKTQGEENSFQLEGPMVEKARACISSLIEAMPEIPEDNEGEFDKNAWHTWCCEAKKVLREFFLSRSGSDCQFLREVECIVCPNPEMNEKIFRTVMQSARARIAILFIEALFDCVCSALLPPCPEPTDELRVPLALITVRSGDCRIVKVCNWTVLRKFVTSFPNLQYWLSWVPFAGDLRESLQTFCCEIFGLRESMPECEPKENEDVSKPPTGATAATWQGLSSKQFKMSSNFANLAYKASARAPLDAETMFRGAMGAKDAKGQPILETLERANLMQFLMINRLAAPAAARILPDQLKAPLKGITAVLARSATGLETPVESENEIADLKSKLREMEIKVKAQEDKMKKVDEFLKKPR